MPNQGNKSNGKSGIVQSKKNSTLPSKKKDTEGNAKSVNTGQQAAGTRNKAGGKTQPSEDSM